MNSTSKAKKVGWVLNSPYKEPNRYWKLNEYGRATEEIESGRRESAELIPVPNSEIREPNPAIEPYRTINEIRTEVSNWRRNDYPSAARETVELLEHFTDDMSERPFFCQVESLETFIWLEYIGNSLQGEEKARWEQVYEHVKDVSGLHNKGIQRRAFKMATGTGKTKTMAMILAWLAICRKKYDVLVIAPNTTIREQLRSLKTEIEKITPTKYLDHVRKLNITVLNFQAFQQRSTAGFDDQPSRVVLQVIGENALHVETPGQMLTRLLKNHNRHQKFVVINDEAHHCRAGDKKESGEGDRESNERRLWFTAIDTLNQADLLEFVLDFSATPMYLTKPKVLDSAVFPWTITDYPLIEAIEAGLVKIPRVPIVEDSDAETSKAARNVYENTPNKELAISQLTQPVEPLLRALIVHHEKNAIQWRSDWKIEPVFIVVANSIKNAIVLYQHIAGYKTEGDEWVPGNFEQFSNIKSDRSGPRTTPPTILVTSRIDDMERQSTTDENRGIDQQIEIHAPDLVEIHGKRAKFKERMREIFLTVGKPNKLGEHIKCVVSVSMLTEGWDTLTVTSIFGFRAFSSSLLCEQVVGRALRRTEHNFNSEGRLSECYADIFGVPFEFMRDRGQPPPEPLVEVRVLTEREPDFHMNFPNIENYKWNLPAIDEIKLDSEKISHFELPKVVETHVPISGPVGDLDVIEVTETLSQRNGCYILASVCTDIYLKQQGDKFQPIPKRSVFRQFLPVVEQWWQNPKVTVDDSNISVNDNNEPSDETRSAANAVIASLAEPKARSTLQIIEPIFDIPNPNSTRLFSPYRTASKKRENTVKSVINIAVCDSESERQVVKALDQHKRISRWVRNDRLGWTIPWYDERKLRWRKYHPDFVAEVDNWKCGKLHLVIEFKGWEEHEDRVKRDYAQKYWIRAVNNCNHSSCNGFWKYVYVQSSKQGNTLKREILGYIETALE